MNPTRPIETDAGPRRRAGSTIARVVAVAAILVASGGVRAWQVNRVEAALAVGRESPFPLESIPMSLGSWSGVATVLDERIVEATGSTDHVTRHYVDQRTGAAVDVIILYGPTNAMFIHSPELCYPKAGYAVGGETFERAIACGASPVTFRSLAYMKGDPARLDLQEVYFAWRYGGRWSTTVSKLKELERIPGMYKVQIARRISPREDRRRDNPCEAFLEMLLPDLEARIAGHPPRG